MRTPGENGLLTLEQYVDGVRNCDRAVLGRAITLIESAHAEHQVLAGDLLNALLPLTGGAHRIGITGVPGVGKSTFIDAVGTNLTAAGHRVAVLTIDPSSAVSGGSILGDKTRMNRLSVDPMAFIRPTPSARTLGGVARKTRESLLLCEAAGFDIVLVETVGVGQSETVVSDMVDFFLVLMLAGAGDELQGIKRGVLEMADMIAINKADGDNAQKAKLAAAEYRQALHLMRPASPNWEVPVQTCSAVENLGLDELWTQIERHRQIMSDTGELAAMRSQQRLRWMWGMVEDRLLLDLRENAAISAMVADLETQVVQGDLSPTVAARIILDKNQKT
jgi:GTPase